MRIALLTGLVYGALAWCELACAQSVPGLHVVVDELSEAASACGISGALIESAATHTLQERGIRVVPGSASPYSYLYITAKVAPERAARAAQSDCVVETLVEVIEVSPTQKPVGGFKGPKPVRGMVEAVRCSIAARRSGSPSELRMRFARELEQRIELCLDRLT